MAKPILLHCGDDVRWNHELYGRLKDTFEIKRSYSMPRDEFKQALQDQTFGDFFAIFRPFFQTGGEMIPWDSELIDLLPPSCKIYASACAGFDWVDVERLAQRGIVYCNSAAACTESVADAAIYLIINTFRHFSHSALAARSLNVEKFREAQMSLMEGTMNPAGHTLGIIGLGRIGQRIARKASLVFPMNVIYNDVSRLPQSVEDECGAKFYENLDDMLAMADCVVVATPFGGSKVLDAVKISKMKQGSRLVNIARGKLIDEDALVEALESGQIQSAALDVHFDEPKVNPKLAAMENVELLSHNAGASIDSQKGFSTLSMENILSFYETGKALTPVNLQHFERESL
ncbi:hypothetical protein LTR37_000229 [Vermiconidia calcicola]|uniref:Uncharacterized protein n=1 Tax=Vermiconidia calcicola TaxID=1690605 RepID=A0ACC3NZW6_9PEZI|nr:hypothetical protein LTR37_000229 [Vermiconidia calcicola]